MTAHLHTAVTPGCYRCELGFDDGPDDENIRLAKAIGWEVGYDRGARDAEGEPDRADNPYMNESDVDRSEALAAWNMGWHAHEAFIRITTYHDAQLALVLRDLSRRCHNGASDPWQEFYDNGAAPLLERMADRLERGAK